MTADEAIDGLVFRMTVAAGVEAQRRLAEHGNREPSRAELMRETTRVLDEMRVDFTAGVLADEAAARGELSIEDAHCARDLATILFVTKIRQNQNYARPLYEEVRAAVVNALAKVARRSGDTLN